ncbi:hypothetical protein [Actinosynnema sp. ALI-1.44]|uniref:hypothetical protein n=1 Tax=Actinosynnema sp. ALI-1.44 TaxID=1933779 RepID=UPI003F8D6F02
MIGWPDAIITVWPKTTTQMCGVQLPRNGFRYAGRQRGDPIAQAAARMRDNAWARVRAVVGVCRGGPASDLLDQRHRKRARPGPPGRRSP